MNASAPVTEMIDDEPVRKPRWLTWLLVILPAWCIVSTIAALWYYFHREERDAQVENERFAQAISIPMLEDDLNKIVQWIGPRNTASDAEKIQLSRAASMIEGLLGPTNTGYDVTKHRDVAEWPIMQVSLAGKNRDAAPLWIITSYDSPANSRGAETNASGLAATLAAAQATARDQPTRPVHFLFLPHAYHHAGSADESFEKIRTILTSNNSPYAVWWIEAMGTSEKIFIETNDSQQPWLHVAAGIAQNPLELPPAFFLQKLTEDGIDLNRISTQLGSIPAEQNERVPFAPTVAISSGKLVEMIRRTTLLPVAAD